MDIGSLTGQVSIEDQLSDKLTEVMHHVTEFADEFEGSMGMVAISIGVVTAAVAGMAISIVEMGEEGSKILGVENAFDHLAESAGSTGEALREGLLSGVKGTIDDMAAMQSTVKLLGSGMKLTTEQAELMGKAARELGKATGGDATDGLNAMSRALTSGQTRSLQMQIGLIDVKAGEEKFAESIGTTVDRLNDVGKLEGKRIAILDATQAYLDRLGVSELSFAEKIKQGEVAFDDWLDELKKGIASSADVNKALDTIGAAISAAFGADKQGITDALLGGINAFARGVTAAVPYIVDFAAGVKDAFVWSEQFWPVIKLAAEAFVVYEGVLLASSAGTWLFTAATTAAEAIGTIYTATMAMMAGETATFGATLTTALGPIGLITIAVVGMIEGWKAASKETGWVRELSDSFEYASLRVHGFSAAEADAMIATDHATQRALEHSKSLTDLQKAQENVNSVMGTGIEIENKAADAGDNHRFITDKLTEAQKKYNAALAEYSANTGGDYLAVTNKIGVALYEGIAFDHARGISTETLSEVYKVNKGVIEEVIASEKKWVDLKKETAAAHKIEQENLAGLVTGMNAASEADIKFAKSWSDVLAALKSTEQSIPSVVSGFERMADNLESVGMKSSEIDLIKAKLAAADEATKKFNATLKGQLLLTLESVPQTIVQSLTGGGGFLGAAKAIGSQIGSVIGKSIGDEIGKGASGVVEGLGKLAGPIGSALGSLAGPLISGLTYVFSGGAEHVINPVREAFVQLNGGLDALNIKAHDAGTTLDAMLNAKNPDQYKKAIDDLNAAFERQKLKVDTDTASLTDLLKQGQALGVTLPQSIQDSIQRLIDMGKVTGDTQSLLASLTGAQTVNFKQMSDIATKYGADLNNLGPRFEAAKIHDTANTIINDFDTLQRGLGDTDEALTVMKKPINDLVIQSIKFGVDIPANMKPWIEQLETTGQLVDENGDKITDLSKIKFGDAIATQFQTLIDKISKLIDTIAGPQGLNASLGKVPTKVTTEIVTVHTDVYNTERADDNASMAATGGLVTNTGIEHFGFGGKVLGWPKPSGTDTVRAMVSPGEIILNAAQQNNVAANLQGGGGGDVTIENNFTIAADVDSQRTREQLRRVVDEATMMALRRQKRLNVA